MASSELNADPAAIVLVGGRSTRMGADKASLVVQGVSMQDRVLAAVAEAGINTTITAGTESGAQGPLAGVVGAWRALSGRPGLHADPVIVLACDLPWLVADVIADLVIESLRHDHGAVAHDGEQRQPLVAAYRPAALDQMVTAYSQGQRSLRRCFTDWDLGTVSVNPLYVRDADTPEDLAGFDVEWPL